MTSGAHNDGGAAAILSLAERCEAATGPDRELDVAIAVSTGVIDKTIDPALVKNATASTMDHGWVDYQYEGDYYTDCAKPFTSSLDAALTLVAKGIEKEFTDLYGVARATVGLNANPGPFYGENECGSLALALCAAALKARAETDREGA